MTTNSDRLAGLAFLFGSVLLCALVIFGSVAGCGAFKNWQRGQKQADARNNVKITTINIQKAQQQARITHAQNKVVQAQAEQRVIKAVGIRKAQDHIAATLTPLYVQWEAIQAQLEMAHSQNHTMLWAPVGANGVPLVSTVDVQKVAEGAAPGK